METFLNSRVARYVYIALLFTSTCIFYWSIFNSSSVYSSENFSALTCILAPTLIASILALFLIQRQYDMFLLATIAYIFFFVVFIANVGISDPSSGGMWGFTKENVGFFGAFIYSVAATVFFGYNFYQKYFPK